MQPSARTIDQRNGICERIVVVSVGKPAMISAPNAASGREHGPVDDRSISARRAAFHAFQDQVVARLHADMEMRHQTRFIRDQAEQVVDFRRIDRAEPQPRQIGHQRSRRLIISPSRGLPGRSSP